MPNGEINNTPDSTNIEKIWSGSYIAVKEVETPAFQALPSNMDKFTDLGIILCIVIFFLLAFGILVQGLAVVFRGIFNVKRLMEIEDQVAARGNRNTLLAFVTITAVFILSNNIIKYSPMLCNGYFQGKPVWLAFGIVTAAVGLFIIVRSAVLRVINWVNKTSAMKYVEGALYSYLIIFTLMALPVYLIFTINDNLAAPFLKYYFLAVALTIWLLYAFRIYKIIISKGFSLSFLILYLCTFEILPVILITNALF